MQQAQQEKQARLSQFASRTMTQIANSIITPTSTSISGSPAASPALHFKSASTQKESDLRIRMQKILSEDFEPAMESSEAITSFRTAPTIATSASIQAVIHSNQRNPSQGYFDSFKSPHRSTGNSQNNRCSTQNSSTINFSNPQIKNSTQAVSTKPSEQFDSVYSFIQLHQDDPCLQYQINNKNTTPRTLHSQSSFKLKAPITTIENTPKSSINQQILPILSNQTPLSQPPSDHYLPMIQSEHALAKQQQQQQQLHHEKKTKSLQISIPVSTSGDSLSKSIIGRKSSIISNNNNNNSSSLLVTEREVKYMEHLRKNTTNFYDTVNRMEFNSQINSPPAGNDLFNNRNVLTLKDLPVGMPIPKKYDHIHVTEAIIPSLFQSPSKFNQQQQSSNANSQSISPKKSHLSHSKQLSLTSRHQFFSSHNSQSNTKDNNNHLTTSTTPQIINHAITRQSTQLSIGSNLPGVHTANPPQQDPESIKFKKLNENPNSDRDSKQPETRDIVRTLLKSWHGSTAASATSTSLSYLNSTHNNSIISAQKVHPEIKHQFTKRQEAQGVRNWVSEKLEELLQNQQNLSVNAVFTYFQNVFQASLSELIRQIGTECKDRGEILQEIWDNQVNLSEKIFISLSNESSTIEKNSLQEINRLHKHYQTELQRCFNEIDSKTQFNEKIKEQLFKSVQESRLIRKSGQRLEKNFKILNNQVNQLQEEYNMLFQENLALLMHTKQITWEAALEQKKLTLEEIYNNRKMRNQLIKAGEYSLKRDKGPSIDDLSKKLEIDDLVKKYVIDRESNVPVEINDDIDPYEEDDNRQAKLNEFWKTMSTDTSDLIPITECATNTETITTANAWIQTRHKILLTTAIQTNSSCFSLINLSTQTDSLSKSSFTNAQVTTVPASPERRKHQSKYFEPKQNTNPHYQTNNISVITTPATTVASNPVDSSIITNQDSVQRILSDPVENIPQKQSKSKLLVVPTRVPQIKQSDQSTEPYRTNPIESAPISINSEEFQQPLNGNKQKPISNFLQIYTNLTNQNPTSHPEPIQEQSQLSQAAQPNFQIQQTTVKPIPNKQKKRNTASTSKKKEKTTTPIRTQLKQETQNQTQQPLKQQQSQRQSSDSSKNLKQTTVLKHSQSKLSIHKSNSSVSQQSNSIVSNNTLNRQLSQKRSSQQQEQSDSNIDQSSQILVPSEQYYNEQKDELPDSQNILNQSVLHELDEQDQEHDEQQIVDGNQQTFKGNRSQSSISRSSHSSGSSNRKSCTSSRSSSYSGSYSGSNIELEEQKQNSEEILQKLEMSSMPDSVEIKQFIQNLIGEKKMLEQYINQLKQNTHPQAGPQTRSETTNPSEEEILPPRLSATATSIVITANNNKDNIQNKTNQSQGRNQKYAQRSIAKKVSIFSYQKTHADEENSSETEKDTDSLISINKEPPSEPEMSTRQTPNIEKQPQTKLATNYTVRINNQSIISQSEKSLIPQTEEVCVPDKKQNNQNQPFIRVSSSSNQSRKDAMSSPIINDMQIQAAQLQQQQQSQSNLLIIPQQKRSNIKPIERVQSQHHENRRGSFRLDSSIILGQSLINQEQNSALQTPRQNSNSNVGGFPQIAKGSPFLNHAKRNSILLTQQQQVTQHLHHHHHHHHSNRNNPSNTQVNSSFQQENGSQLYSQLQIGNSNLQRHNSNTLNNSKPQSINTEPALVIRGRIQNTSRQEIRSQKNPMKFMPQVYKMMNSIMTDSLKWISQQNQKVSSNEQVSSTVVFMNPLFVQVYEYFLYQFGLRKVAEIKLVQMLEQCLLLRDESKLVALFLSLYLQSDSKSTTEWRFVCKAYSLLVENYSQQGQQYSNSVRVEKNPTSKLKIIQAIPHVFEDHSIRTAAFSKIFDGSPDAELAQLISSQQESNGQTNYSAAALAAAATALTNTKVEIFDVLPKFLEIYRQFKEQLTQEYYSVFYAIFPNVDSACIDEEGVQLLNSISVQITSSSNFKQFLSEFRSKTTTINEMNYEQFTQLASKYSLFKTKQILAANQRQSNTTQQLIDIAKNWTTKLKPAILPAINSNSIKYVFYLKNVVEKLETLAALLDDAVDDAANIPYLQANYDTFLISHIIAQFIHQYSE